LLKAAPKAHPKTLVILSAVKDLQFQRRQREAIGLRLYASWMADPQHLEMIKKGPQEWNQWRLDNDVTNPNLRGANLLLAKLRGVNLRGASLSDAKLSMTDLREADLSNADLTAVNLFKGHLVGANLTGANLKGAKLSETDLREANLSGALLVATVFGNLNLAETKGLDKCVHRGPSILDYQTLAKSGRLPLPFLQGCGLPDIFIEYLPSLLSHGVDFYSCFISYSHEDKRFARELHDALQRKGIRCWLDEKQLRGGDDILDQVDSGIRLWDKVLLCCSKNSLNSGWVETELDKALEKEQTLRKERGEKVLALIPLNLDGYLFNGWQSGRASIVKQRLAIDFNGWEESHTKCEAKIEEVIRALRSGEHARERPPISKL
jgi:uncharacterized protein YjbI with pentapeptide repeats